MQNSNASINQKLASAPIRPLLIQLSVPATVAQLVNALYSIVDRMFIGHLPNIGSIALSGVGLTFPVTMLIAAFSYLPSSGGAPLSSIAIGNGNIQKAQKIMCNSITLLLFISCILTAGCLFWLEPILQLFGADASTMPYAYEYLQVYLIGTVFVQLSLGLNFFINAQGFTLTGTLSIVIGAVLNLILDPLFLYVLGMGVRGAAIATVISQFASCVWNVAFLCSRKSNIRICLRDMIPDWGLLSSTCALGVSPFTFRVNESLVAIFLNRLILVYGGIYLHQHLATMTILNSIYQIFFMPLTGLVNGVQPILSYNFGARNYSRIREAIHHARVLSFGCAIVMWAALMVFPQAICHLFTSDVTLISITKKAMRIMFCTVFSLGFQMINQNAFVAMGNTKFSFLFGIMRKLLFLMPLAILLPRFFGVWGIYAAETISNPATTAITFGVFERYMSGLRRNFETTSLE